MRTQPQKTIKNTPELLAKSQQRIDAVTHKVAIYFCLLIVVFFFFKMILP